MLKAVFFDLDGVLTTDANGSLTMSKNLCAVKQGLALDDVLKSFRTDVNQLSSGQCSLQSVIERVCKECSIPFSSDLPLDVASKIPWNAPMLALSHSLPTSCVRGIITDNCSERVEILSHQPELAGFSPIAVSAVERASKADGSSKIFDIALERAGCSATDAVFIDNQRSNLITAAKMGIVTLFHDHIRNDVMVLRSALGRLGIEMKDRSAK